VGFQINPFRALDPLQRAANRIRLAAEHFQFGSHFEIVGRFGGSAKAIQNQPTIVEGSWIAAATFDRCAERIERLRLVTGEERMDAAAVQVFKHGVLAVAGGCRQGQEGSCYPKIFTGHEPCSTI
jgi:hypothetical protein